MPAKKKSAGKKKRQYDGPVSFAVPEEMKQWSSLLTQEISGWPQVEAKSMFGMKSFYRKEKIFAALPDKRGFFTPYSIIFKLQTPTDKQVTKMKADPRINLKFGVGQKWYGFELASPDDIRGALEWLDEAFHAAKAAKKRK